jgi:hypothetical protein
MFLDFICEALPLVESDELLSSLVARGSIFFETGVPVATRLGALGINFLRFSTPLLVLGVGRSDALLVLVAVTGLELLFDPPSRRTRRALGAGAAVEGAVVDAATSSPPVFTAV